MNDEFFQKIISRPRPAHAIPPNKEIAAWAWDVIRVMFPECADGVPCTTAELKKKLEFFQEELFLILSSGVRFSKSEAAEIARLFFDGLPALYDILTTDIQAIYDGDPAARSEFEVVRTYPGFYAICFYRIAHALTGLGLSLIPRILTEHAHSVTGIDIHPSAVIGEYFHIDHGTGIVIGETCTIGNNVKLYQGVTLGALSVSKDLAGVKRHPTVEDGVIIYAAATILGGDTVIGHNSVIGGNVWLTKSVAPHSTVYHSPTIHIQKATKK
ncbi:MAG: serine acetyltransferase [Sphingobacteriaceae bacterium]|nr:MAG: serine acetyltransferase [Sphingobacteriaceae bacterium]